MSNEAAAVFGTDPPAPQRRRVRFIGIPSAGRVVVGLITAALLAVIIYPIGRTILEVYVPDGHPTVAPFRRLLADPAIDAVVRDTVVYGVGTLLLATALGLLLAWANERTDARIGWLSGVLPLIPLIVPPIGSVIGYTLLFSSHSGFVNMALRHVFHLSGRSGPVDIHSMGGLILVSGINLAPLTYLVISAAFKNLDNSLDEASRVSGASVWRTIRRITVPAVRPALASAALMVGIMAVGMFSFPLVIGTSANITVASVYIFRLFSAYPPSLDIAVSLGLFMLVFVQIAVLVQQRLTYAGRHAVVAGKQAAGAQVRLGAWRWPVRVFMVLYLVAVVGPVVGLILGSLQPYIGSPISLDTLSLDQIKEVLNNPLTKGALVNSVVLGAVTAIVSVLLAATLAFSAGRKATRTGRIAQGVAFLPAAIPHIVLAGAFLVAFSRPPVELYGTPLILLLAYTVLFMPQAVAAASAAVSQKSQELSEASRVCGAGPVRTAFRIVMPQVLPGFLGGCIIVFCMASNEVTASALLGGLGNAVVGQVAADYFDTGRLGEVAVLALIMTVITAVLVASLARVVSRTYAGRSLS